MSDNRKALLAGLIVALAIPHVVPGEYWVHLLNLSLFYVMLAVGLNILAGYAGQFLLSQGAFFGIAAYTASLLVMRLHLPIIAGILGAVAFTVVVGMFLAVPSVRIRGSYLCIATLGFSTIVYQLILNLEEVTRGPMGLVGIPTFPGFSLAGIEVNFVRKTPWYYVLLFLTLALLYLERRVIGGTRIGLALRSIREDELAAEATGIQTFKYKVIAFTFSALFAGIAGSVYGFYLGFLAPELFAPAESIRVMTIVIFGGFGHIPAIVTSALVLTIVPETLRLFSGGMSVRFLVYGALLVVVMILVPEGLGGILRSIRMRFIAQATAGNRMHEPLP